MKYIQRTGLMFFIAILFAGAMAISASAQARVSVRTRPVVVRGFYGPRWHGGFYRNYWGWNDPFWNDPYYTDPRIRELADRVHNENEVNSSARKLREYNEKFSADGYISEKEQKKIDKEQRKHDKYLDRLRNGG